MPGNPQNRRTLMDGSYVKVSDAKRDLPLTFSARALKEAKNTPNQCAIANQGRMTTGHDFEVYRSIAFERDKPSHVLRYELKNTGRLVMQANDLNLKAMARLAGLDFILKRPAKSHTLPAHRARAAASRKRKHKKRSLPGRKIADALKMRERATAWMKHS